MSGRLTILPKKTYCPWKPENIERVLRDERLERERIDKESANAAKHKQQRLQYDGSSRIDGVKRGDIKSNEESNKEKGHINLFPEAKEAELRLTQGPSSTQQTNNNNGIKIDESGVAPIPLGGNESINRKVGNVPFYMRSTIATASTSIGKTTGTTSNVNREEKYKNTNNSFRLGTKRSTNNNNYTNTTNNIDAITNKLMQDQYIQREDNRKRNMDPMNRFYVDANSTSTIRGSGIGNMESAYANGSANGITGSSGLVNRGNRTSEPTNNNDKKIRSSLDEEDVKGEKYKRKKKKRRKRSYSSDSSTSSSSSSVDRDRHKKKRRKHKSKKKKRSSSHRDHHKHHHHEKRRRHDKNNTNVELEELRRRRHAREANERERLNNTRGDASSSFDGSTIHTKDTRYYDGSIGFH